MAIIKKTGKWEEEKHEEIEKHWPQIIAILIGTLSGFTEGINFAWTSPFIVKITEDKINYDINEEQVSFLSTIMPIATIIGCPIFTTLSDIIGRKKTFLLSAVLHILGWIFAIFASDIYLFYANRICAGLANSCFFGVFPLYVGEIVNPTVRGSWGNLLATSMYVGELYINIIGSYFDVKNTSYICLPLPIVFIILFSLMPESPYFYVMKEKEEKAKNSLRFLTRKHKIDTDYLKLKKDVDRQLSESGSWSDLFKIKSNRRALMAGIFLRITQSSSGLIIFVVFTQSIFQKSGGNINRENSSIIFLGANAILNVIVLLFIVSRFARRTLYTISLSSSAVVLYILGTYFYLDEYYPTYLSSFKWVPITGMLMYLVFASFGIAVIPTLMMSELFSASVKAKGMTFLLVCMSVGNIIFNSSFYYLVEFLGFHSPFYFYAICNTVATVLSFYIIPETKGKTLEEIQQILKKKNMRK